MSVEFSRVSTKNGYVYEELRRRILSGELEPGQSIPQGQLAVELGVSTTPMREALRRLGAEGLVAINAHRDAHVAALDAEEARSLFEVRERLDPLAAGLAASRRTVSDVIRIESALGKLKPLTDTTDLQAMDAHREFHRAVYNASHSDILIAVLEGLWDKADRYRQVGLRFKADSPSDSKRVMQEHAEIAEAVISKNQEAAELHMREHVAGSLGRRAIDALEPAPAAAKSSEA